MLLDDRAEETGAACSSLPPSLPFHHLTFMAWQRVQVILTSFTPGGTALVVPSLSTCRWRRTDAFCSPRIASSPQRPFQVPSNTLGHNLPYTAPQLLPPLPAYC